MSVEDGMSAQEVWSYPIIDPADPTRAWAAADLLKWANAGANEVADVPVNVLAAKVATPDGSQSYTVAQHLAWTTQYAEQAVATLDRIADKLGVAAVTPARPAVPAADAAAVVVQRPAETAPAVPDPASGTIPASDSTPVDATPPTDTGPAKTSGLTGYAISLIRTYVPLAWGTVIGALLSWGVLPSDWAGEAKAVGTSVIVPLTVAAFYALVRWLERQKWMPRGVVLAVLGSDQAPSYQK